MARSGSSLAMQRAIRLSSILTVLLSAPLQAQAAQGSLSVQFASAASRPAPPPPAPWFHLIEALAWPVAIGLLAILFRDPLSQFMKSIGGRISKFSLFNVSVELATARNAGQTPLLEEIRKLAQSAVINDSSGQLFAQVQSAEPADYVLINLGAGEEWLTSRLFLAAVMMERMRGVRAFVFLRKTPDSERKFVATADVRLLRWRLAQSFPWLEAAYARAYGNAFPPMAHGAIQQAFSDNGALQAIVAQNLAREFLRSLQRAPQKAKPGAAKNLLPDPEWIALDSMREERANWVTPALLASLLPLAAFDAKVTERDDQSHTELVRALLRRPESLVTVVDASGQFRRVIDRAAYLESLAIGQAREES